MTVEGDIAGFALPFAAGVIAASLIPYTHINGTSISTGIILVGILTFVISGRFRHTDLVIQWTCLSLTAFLCGFLCMSAGYARSLTTAAEPGKVEAWTIHLCSRFKHAIDAIPFQEEDTKAVLKALLSGDRSDMPRQLTEAFRESGGSHILALSGMHLGIVYAILTKILACTGNSTKAKKSKSAIIITVCGLYTLGTGAGESMTRALLFIILHETATLLYRRTKLKETLMAALIIQLSLVPTSVNSVSFQLSYAAMAGIAFINPTLRNFWPHSNSTKGIMRRIWESASLSISCQITTGPLAWIYFKSFPQHFLLTNLLAVPLAGIIIPVSLITIALNSANICPVLMITITEWLTEAMIGILKTIAAM